MYLYFEEDGAFKAGTVLSEAGNAYQVELLSGKRTKVKANRVFLSFESPSPASFLEQAQALMPELDPQFLWEASPEGDFSFEDLAKDYFGDAASVVERAAMLLALHEHPVYFYRKGRGQYRRAPEDILARALEALERKRKQEEIRKAWVDEMVSGHLPEALKPQALTLLINPDKNSIEWKALSDAASVTRNTPLRLMLKLGGIASEWRWHVDSFFATNFPRGRHVPPIPFEADPRWERYPLADVKAFSIDDSETTEVDDAVSVTPLDGNRTRVGIHIAAPAIGIERGSEVDEAAKARMSTIYAPGLKTTMLPEAWIKGFSLDEGRAVPCLSLYVYVDNETFSIERQETCIERIKVARNIRYDLVDHLVTEEAILNKTLDIEFAEEISWLWHFSNRLVKDREEVRGRPEPKGRVDWFFALEGEGEDAKIVVRGRRRGAPLDQLVAELMILANSAWGLWLEEHQTAGIYRSQRMGRVRMSTTPGPHDGLGVVRYAWSTSPLRRYVDLINQRQMISVLEGGAPSYAANDVDLFTIVSQFETIYGLYGDFQTRMERYWSLRWILQEGLKEIEAIIVKGDLVRIDGLPFMQRLPGLPEDLERGKKVRLQILGCDLVDLVMDARLLAVLDTCEAIEEEDPLLEEDPSSELASADAAEEAREEAEEKTSEAAAGESVSAPTP